MSLSSRLAPPASRWDRALAHALVASGVTLFACAHTFGFSPAVLLYTWLVCTSSLGIVLFAGLGCAIPARPGTVWTITAFVVLHVAGAWLVGSMLLYQAQGRGLLWFELVQRFREPASRGFFLEMVFSWRTVVYTLAFVLGSVGLLRVLKDADRQRCAVATLAIVGGSSLAGVLLVLVSPDDLQAARFRKPASSPWAREASHLVDTEDAHGFDLEEARRLRAELPAPFWEEGEDAELAPLLGRFRGRSVIVLFLESHRESNIDGLGAGAFAHVPCSPFLGSLAGESLVFENYLASAYSTNSAIWSTFTGLPNAVLPSICGSCKAPEAGVIGRLPDFAAAGYLDQWLCTAHPHFDGWARMLAAGGAEWVIEKSETDELDQDSWNSYGIPDHQLLDLAYDRYLGALRQGRPILLGALTTSNHPPFTYPEDLYGEEFPHNRCGALRYVDASVRRLLERLRALPEADRPLVFVTADSANRDDLRDHQPLGFESLESVRIPGILWAPDGSLAGQRVSSLFCHEDLLDLIHGMVIGPADGDAPAKFVNRRRRLATFMGSNPFSVASLDLYLHGGRDRLYRIVDRWRLVEADDDPGGAPLRDAAAFLRQRMEGVWPLAR